MFEFIDSFAASNGHAGRHNLFFALRPSSTEAIRIHRLGLRLRQGAGLAGSVTSADRLHVSLHGLGEYRTLPKRVVDAACEAGERLVFPHFVVTFDSAGSFRAGRSGKWPFVLRSVHDIDALPSRSGDGDGARGPSSHGGHAIHAAHDVVVRSSVRATAQHRTSLLCGERTRPDK